jgi:hypothetical protein
VAKVLLRTRAKSSAGRALGSPDSYYRGQPPIGKINHDDGSDLGRVISIR